MEAHISALVSKKSFFSYVCGLCPPTPLASGSTEDLPWLPTELRGALGGRCHHVPRGFALWSLHQTTLSCCA